MRKLGFSTGALALEDFRRGLDLCKTHKLAAVELSALRLPELRPLIDALPGLDLGAFAYVSLHAPSRYLPGEEPMILGLLEKAAARGIPVVVHPDAICDVEAWKSLGPMLLLENMDRRKPVGRSVAELEPLFDRLPAAGFCFDIGHARQFDPSMVEAELLLRRFRGRIRQLHVSEVNTFSRHERLSYLSYFAFRRVASLIPLDAPVILEARVGPEEIGRELRFAQKCLAPEHVREPEARPEPLIPAPAW